MDAITHPPAPVNEKVLDHVAGSPERERLVAALADYAGPRELDAVIGGVHRRSGGEAFTVVAPHDHQRVLATSAAGTGEDARAAIDAALQAAPAWRDLGFDDRAAIFLRAADLLSGPWRARANAATMLGQSKSVY